MTPPDPVQLPNYTSRGARALVMVHEAELRKFLGLWREAEVGGLELPAADDPSYASLGHLLHHVLRAARGYMVWCCETLGLPDPGIDKTPPPEEVSARADAYLEHLLERWATPLAGVTDEQLEVEAPSRWKVSYCVDAMLEHAVMHPLRHSFQLRALLTGK